MNRLNKQLQEQVYLLKKETEYSNWDLENGEAISPFRWTTAWEFAQIVSFYPQIPLPFFSPCGDGSVHVVYSWPDSRQVTIEVWGDQFRWISRECNGFRSYGVTDDYAVAIKRILKIAHQKAIIIQDRESSVEMSVPEFDDHRRIESGNVVVLEQVA